MHAALLQTEEDAEKHAAASSSRTVNLAGGVPADKTAGFAKNNIQTPKYNLITVFPIFLFEMFSRAAYLYFLAQVMRNAQLSHAHDSFTPLQCNTLPACFPDACLLSAFQVYRCASVPYL